MKKALTLILLAILVIPSLRAQQADTAQKRETFIVEDRYYDAPGQRTQNLKKNKVVVKINGLANKENRRNKFVWNDGHWAGIGLHYSGLVTNLGKLKLPEGAEFLSQSAKSIGVTLNPIDFTLLRSGRFGLITGLGVEFNNFRFDSNVALTYENGMIRPNEQYENVKLSKSKLYTCYLNIPLLIEFQMGRHHDFFINAGVVGGWRMGAHTKIKASDPQLSGKFKERGNMGLRNFHYGYTVNIGYSHFAISATYYRPSIFRPGHGPQVEQVNIGLTLML